MISMSEDTDIRCASCGVKEGEGDDVKLKNCTGCYLVQYCGVKCQRSNWKQHKRACKERAAELHDELLFKQPESSHMGDCPICFLPLSIDEKKSMLMTCCSKTVCTGCVYANIKLEREEGRDEKCPFCRTPIPKSQTEADNILKERVKMNDPAAMCEFGTKCRENGDYQSAFEYYSKAAELGDVAAHLDLAMMYYLGEGVEKDESKKVYHFEQAAIGGHPEARYNLGVFEWWYNGRRERAVKHWIIAAKLGHDESLEHLKGLERADEEGLVSKDDLAEVLRGHQAAVEATKSPQRDEAATIAATKSVSQVMNYELSTVSSREERIGKQKSNDHEVMKNAQRRHVGGQSSEGCTYQAVKGGVCTRHESMPTRKLSASSFSTSQNGMQCGNNTTLQQCPSWTPYQAACMLQKVIQERQLKHFDRNTVNFDFESPC